MKTNTMTDTTPLSILTTDRPLPNIVRRQRHLEKFGWRFEYDPKPVPNTSHDWNWWHVDYDGAPDSTDNRCGTAASIDDAMDQISELITSPPAQGQPQDVTFLSVFGGVLGWALLGVTLAGWLVLLDWALEVV